MKVEVKTVSSMEKVFQDGEFSAPQQTTGSALWGETYAYQIALKLRNQELCSQPLTVEVVSDIADKVSLYTVHSVPVYTTHIWGNEDDGFIKKNPGLYPDVMEPCKEYVMVSSHGYTALWVDMSLDKSVLPGKHEVCIRFKKEDEVCGESVFVMEVIAEELPFADFPYTDWIHCDCISSYHHCEPLSERHWQLMEAYIKMAAEHGINMLLTPIFTLALDTAEGAERPTVQLVDVFFRDGTYTFEFQNLKRWLDLCRKYGISYIEVSHLYTQWGAKHAPKIMVYQDGNLVKKFGWETDSMGEEYKEFIRQLLPALTAFFEEHWEKEKVYFHISDEPSEEHIEYYGEIYRFIHPLLNGFKQFDAMSSYPMYQKGFIHTPVVGITRIDDFITNHVDNIWLYYCCTGAVKNFSNRAIAMPSYRNRILGFQMFKFDIKGFLHWGYNFYYSQFSRHLINPYLTTDADGSFFAGDSFCVYPGTDGPLPSVRLKVFHHALQDLRAAKLLESKVGKEEVLKLIEACGEIDFSDYPRNAEYILDTREQINQKIKEWVHR